MFKRFFVAAVFVAAGIVSAHAGDMEHDTSDPVYMLQTEEILSVSNVAYYDSILRIGQALSYGINDRLSAGMSVHYQNDFDG